jgi:hypothetical protein
VVYGQYTMTKGYVLRTVISHGKLAMYHTSFTLHLHLSHLADALIQKLPWAFLLNHNHNQNNLLRGNYLDSLIGEI